MTSSWVRDVLLPRLSLLAMPILSSINATLCRAAMSIVAPGEEILHPFTLAVTRCIIAALVMGAIRHSGWWAPPDKKSSDLITPSLVDYGGLFAIGLVGITANIAFFLAGIALTDNITVAAMQCAVPPTCYLLGWYLGSETMTRPKMLATLFVVLGSFIVTHAWRPFTGDFTADRSPSYYLGIASLLGNNLCFSIYMVMQKPLLRKFSYMDFISGVMAVGGVGMVFLSLLPRANLVTGQLLSGKLSTLSWITIANAGVVQSCLAYMLLAYGINKSGSPLLASLINSLQPVLIAIEAVTILGEQFDKWAVIGGVIVVISLIFTSSVNIMGMVAAASAPSAAVPAGQVAGGAAPSSSASELSSVADAVPAIAGAEPGGGAERTNRDAHTVVVADDAARDER